MSGTIGSNILSHSGIIAESAAGLSWSDTIVTGSTVTVEAGKGYWINTTSNACTITLPSSAEAGDQIVIVDYARTWGTNAVTIDSNGLNFQGNDDSYTVEYTTNGQSVNIVYSDSTKGWLPLEDDVVADEPAPPPTQKGIFPFGYSYVVASDSSVYYGTSNIVNENGVMQADVSAVGGGKAQGAGATYGFDKGIHAFGNNSSGYTNVSNLISNVGVVSTDVDGVGTARLELSAVSYGSGNALFAFGNSGSVTNLKNLVNSSGVVASDSTGVGTAAASREECSYGGPAAGTAIITMGSSGKTNLVSNTGVIATDTNLPSGVSSKSQGAGCTFGDDKGIVGYGSPIGTHGGGSNIISNTGVIAADVSRVGLFRISMAACGYGGDKGIFAFGNFADDPGGSGGSHVGRFGTAVTNLVSNTGVIASDTTGASGVTGKQTEQACGFGN